MTMYEPPVPFGESQSSRIKWSGLVVPVFGNVKVAWEDVGVSDNGYADVIFIDDEGQIIIGGWEYNAMDDEWDKAEPEELARAFYDGFIRTSPDLAAQYAALMKKISPANQQNLALEETLDYISSMREKDCD